MEEHIHEVKTQGVKPENMVINHVNEMHERSVVIGSRRLLLETPDTLREYIRKVFKVSYPAILQHLCHIVVHEAVEQGVKIHGKGNKGDNGTREKKAGFRLPAPQAQTIIALCRIHRGFHCFPAGPFRPSALSRFLR